MQAVQTVLDTITGIIAAFKKFFEDIIKMFKDESTDTDAETDATV